MTKDILISIKGLHALGEEEPDTVELIIPGSYYKKGDRHFIKYDEENLSTRHDVSGPLAVIPEKIAIQEIAFTQLKSNSYNFVAEDQHTGELRKKAQKLKPAKYDPSEEVQLMKPFKLWNPLTW